MNDGGKRENTIILTQFVFLSVNLLRLMNAIVIEGNVSPRISFIVSLLDEAVKCGQKIQQIYTTDDPTKHGKLNGLVSSVGRESAPRISFIVSLLDEAVKCGQ